MTVDKPGNAESDFEIEEDDFILPRMAHEIGAHEITQALNDLTFLGESLAMRFQVTNVGIADEFIMEVETTVRNRLHQEERTPVDDALFLQSSTQMWIFAIYELLRTWKQRLGDIIKLSKNGGLQIKINSLRKGTAYRHFNQEFYADLLERVIADNSLIEKMEIDIKKTAITYDRLEFLRVALAKHEVSGKGNSLAYNPGYARIDRMTGSLQYEMSNDKYIVGTITRRDIADEIRAFPTIDEIPSDKDINDHKRFLEGKLGPGLDF